MHQSPFLSTGPQVGASLRNKRKGAQRKEQEEKTGSVKSMLDFWIARQLAQTAT